MAAEPLTLYYAPNTRAFGALVLLEELECPYQLQVLDLKKGEQRAPAYLAINPMGKVPALRHRDAIVTEQPAIYLYAADLHPSAKLAPALDDARRGPYLRWMVFYGSSFEPALMDCAARHTPSSKSTSPYGDYDTMLGTLTGQLEKGDYLLGESFSAADVLWGIALNWTTRFSLVPELPVIRAYIDRVMARPAVARAKARDAEVTAKLANG